MRFALLAITASLGGLLFGYDTGVVSSALLYVRDVFHLSATLQGLVTSIALAGAALGALVAGSLSDALGRRIVILAAAALFFAGALVSAFAMAFWWLLVGRVIVGAAIGIASALTPLYLSELAPKDRRGGVVTLNQTFLTIGILVSYLVGYAFAHPGPGWRWMFGLGAVPGALLGIGMFVLPESPRWLVGNGRTDDARAALRFVRGRQDVEQELRELHAASGKQDHGTAPWTVFADRRARMPLMIGVALAVLQQVTGINTVIYFAPTIIKAHIIHSASLAILMTAGIGAVNVVFTLVAVWLLDRVGRRGMLLTGIAGMGLFLCGLAATYLGAGGNPGFVAIIMIAAYVAAFAIGLGPVFWLLNAEIFPLAVRGRGMAMATVANWLANLAVTMTFLDIIKAIGAAGIFFIYAGVCILAFLFSARYVPETKGRSLEEIESDLRGSAGAALSGPQPAS
jgi:SP family galactose:H+ symporter-like MFS transporter